MVHIPKLPTKASPRLPYFVILWVILTALCTLICQPALSMFIFNNNIFTINLPWPLSKTLKKPGLFYVHSLKVGVKIRIPPCLLRLWYRYITHTAVVHIPKLPTKASPRLPYFVILWVILTALCTLICQPALSMFIFNNNIFTINLPWPLSKTLKKPGLFYVHSLKVGVKIRIPPCLLRFMEKPVIITIMIYSPWLIRRFQKQKLTKPL